MPQVKASIWIDAPPDRVWDHIAVSPDASDPVGQKAKVTFDREDGWYAVETPGLTVVTDVLPGGDGTELTMTWMYHVAPKLLSVLLHFFTRRSYQQELHQVLQKVKEELEAR